MNFLLNYVAFLFNSSLSILKEDENKVITPETIIHGYKNIYLDNREMWTQNSFETNELDVRYVEAVLEELCRNTLLVNPVHPPWVRICGDVQFLKGNYEKAVTFYLEVLLAQQRGFNSEINESDVDVMFTKISISCMMLKMPTLAAIVGQLRYNPTSHYSLVEWLVFGSANCADAGIAYFPLISDLKLMEHMAGKCTHLFLIN